MQYLITALISFNLCFAFFIACVKEDHLIVQTDAQTDIQVQDASSDVLCFDAGDVKLDCDACQTCQCCPGEIRFSSYR